VLKRMIAVASIFVSLASAGWAQQPAAATPAQTTKPAKPASAGTPANQGMPTAPEKLLDGQPYVLGKPVIRTYPAATYFFVSDWATQKTIPDVMAKLTPHLLDMVKQAGLNVNGPMICVLIGVNPDPNTPFQVEAGFIVDTATKPAGDAEVRPLDSFKAATVLFTGDVKYISKAYEGLYASIFSAGQFPTTEIRQMGLYFEKMDSANNVFMLMVGIQ
jgi:hypothetical protein